MTMDRPELDCLEVVHYSAPVPNSLAALTMMSFVFDRIHFPAVYVPAKGVIDVSERLQICKMNSWKKRRNSAGPVFISYWI